MDAVIAASDPSVPPAQLYAYAYVEGLDDYVRDEIGLGKKDGDPTVTQLASVSTTKAVSGFGHLGIDDFWLDLHATRQPLSVYLPLGYDVSRLAHLPAWNEEKPNPRLVDSVVFPTLALETAARRMRRSSAAARSSWGTRRRRIRPAHHRRTGLLDIRLFQRGREPGAGAAQQVPGATEAV